MKPCVINMITGLFGTSNRALKDCAEHIALYLTDIFNFSLEAKVLPGDKNDLNNY